jgi:hypothetical protein
MSDQIPDVSDAKQFQQLTEEDKGVYGEPKVLVLNPPHVDDEQCRLKRENWIEWRAASYPGIRHSEYLHVAGSQSKVLISAVLPTPKSIEDYIGSLERKHRGRLIGNKASVLGYSARQIDPLSEGPGIWSVIHSMDERQGKPIAKQFEERPRDHQFPEYQPYSNAAYRDVCCGVFAPDGTLSAYLLGKRVGDHVAYDEIMGHADHLDNNVMYFLHISFLEQCLLQDIVPTCLNYGPWYSGQNPYSPEGGLNRWKRRLGFHPAYLILASSSGDSRAAAQR